GVLAIWNLETALPEHVLGAASGQIRSVEFSRDGAQLLSSDSEGQATLWDLMTGEPLRRFVAAAPLNDAVLDPDHGRVLLGTRSGVLEVWSAAGQRQRTVPAHTEWIMDLAIHAPSNQLATAAGDGKVALWSLDTLQQRWSAPAHEGRALSLDFSPDGRLLASAGEDGLVQLWGTAKGEARARLLHHHGAARSVRFSPDGRFLASGGDDGSVRLWDLSRLDETGERLLDSAQRATGLLSNGSRLELSQP
ncbi:MAG TPA: WD40 repeat domain-containing protein, partial [Polyangiaceae bacterium]|nr:WD40 repeat domain-containing protein [Polyangiaceae bacterium]